MERAKKLSITLPASLARAVRDKVESGEYASNSEVIRAALRVWQERDAQREQDLSAIRAALHEAINDRRPRKTPEQVKARLDGLQEQAVRARRRAG